MSHTRIALAVVALLVAVGTAGLLLSASYGLATEYGSGTASTMGVFLVVPVGATLVAVRLLGASRPARVAVAVSTVALVLALVAADHLGGRVAEQRDADRCEGGRSTSYVDGQVGIC